MCQEGIIEKGVQVWTKQLTCTGQWLLWALKPGKLGVRTRYVRVRIPEEACSRYFDSEAVKNPFSSLML
jgi:hypothetical protein